MVWQKGQSGNPGGRPKGARLALSKAVFEETMRDWQKHGVGVIERVREESPAIYLQFVGRMLPQNLELDVTDVRRSIMEYTPAELVEMMNHEIDSSSEPKKLASK